MSTTQDIFNAVRSHAMATGLFDPTETAEPKAAPGNQLSASIWLSRIGPAQGASGLDATTGRVELTVRLYSGMLQEPMGEIDPNLTAACITLMEAYSGDFTLGGVVRNVDLLGEVGTPLQAEAGYINADGKLYRVITITLPMIVNDLWPQAE